MQLNQISHIDNTNCNICLKSNKCIHKTRKQFISRCLPFNNFDETKKNILNFDKTSYIYFYKKNIATYYLKKDFSIKLIKPSASYIKLAAPLFENINILSEDILLRKFNIDDIEIPGYYLFCNYTHIFNIFTTYYKLFFNNIQENIKSNIKLKLHNLEEQLKNIIQQHKDINKLLYKSKEYKDLDGKIGKIQQKLKLSTDTFDLIQLQKELKDLQDELTSLLNTPKYTKGIKALEDLNIKKLDLIKKIYNIKEQTTLEKTINNIFQINDDNNFIKLSYMFNIFNISLLCENYFSIIKLLYKNIIEIEDIINIFKDFNLVNIYYLVNYYKTQIQKKNIEHEFMDLSVKNTNNLNKSDIYNTIIDIEHQMSNITKINIDNIYKELHIQLIYIQLILNEIEQYIPNYKKLFLMAIISYRNYNNLINSTWGYLNKKYIKDFIVNNTTITYRKESKESKESNESITLKKYYKTELPILYENDTVTYKNVNYGNCMENTILQFLKVLFWNRNNNNYDFNKIKEIINDEHEIFIKSQFKNISNEKTLKFINKWTKFITELPNNNFGNYNFLRPQYKVEINPTLDNLIIALKYLIKWKNNNEQNNTKFMTELITKINKDYKINITSTNISDKLELIFNEKVYIINLKHNAHASFEGTNDEILDILNLPKYDNAQNTKLNESFVSFSNLNAYIIYSYFSKKNELFETYINKIDKREKTQLIDKFIVKFTKNIQVMNDLINYYQNILEPENNDKICGIIIDNIISGSFTYNKNKIDELLLNNNIMFILNFNNAKKILHYIKSNKIDSTFYMQHLYEYKVLQKFSDQNWCTIIINHINYYIDIIIKYPTLLNNCGSLVWISIFYTFNKTNDLSLKSKIEQVIRTKYIFLGSNINTIIQLIINNILEIEWETIFKSIKIDLDLAPNNTINDFFIYILQNINNGKLYNLWINTETWNNYLLLINYMLYKNTNYNRKNYNDVNTSLQLSLYLDKIFTIQDIIWDKLDYLLRILIKYDIFDNYYDLILTNNIHNKFSNDIYTSLLVHQHKIFDVLIKRNQLSNNLCYYLLQNIYNKSNIITNFINLIPRIKTYEIYKNWTEIIWLYIIKINDLFILFVYIIFTSNIINHKNIQECIISAYGRNKIFRYIIETNNYKKLPNNIWSNINSINDIEYNIFKYLHENNLYKKLPEDIKIYAVENFKFD